MSDIYQPPESDAASADYVKQRINAKIVTAIAFRLFAIFALTSVVIALPGLLLVGFRAFGEFGSGSYLGPIVIAIISLGFGLFGFKLLWDLGSKVLEALPETPDSYSSNWKELELHLIQLLGVYLLIVYGCDLPLELQTAYLHLISSELEANVPLTLLRTLIPAVIGLLLITRAPALKSILQKFRTAE